MSPAQEEMVNACFDYSEYLDEYEFDFVVNLPDDQPLTKEEAKELRRLFLKVESRLSLSF